jgi:hypothetical protein
MSEAPSGDSHNLSPTISGRDPMIRRSFAPAALLFTLTVGFGCLRANADEPTPQDAPSTSRPALRVLFIGNSLTAFHRLPDLVAALANAQGFALESESLTAGNFSLEDHWRSPHVLKLLRSRAWDFVVLQQGPSSRPESRVLLARWAKRFAEEIAKNGALPALYMVWPFEGQKNGFAQVAKSYRDAAKSAKARILPAGEAWERCLRVQPQLELYLDDGLHPTPAGTYLAALVITQGLTGLAPATAPRRLVLSDGAVFELPEEVAQLLRHAAAVSISD